MAVLKNYRYLLPYTLLLFFLLSYIYNPSVSAHGDQVHTFIDSAGEQKEKIQECLAMPEGEDLCYFAVCEGQNSYLCAQDILDAVVFLAGPEEATRVLEDIMASTLFAIQTDGHQLSHVIGRATSHHFGLSGESFLRCPADFNYGCQHGFFEDALIQHTTPVKAATEICEHIPDRPYKNKFYCYHGVGHGFMFHESYHLKNALDLCDALPSFTAQEGCYQGVFMENVNGFFSDAEGEKGFIDNDTLAPCNRIEDKYRHQCYENHASYILSHHNNSIRDASHACLDAEDYISSCINSLGLMVTNPGWQQTLRGSFNGTFIEIAAHLCNQFPADYIEICQLAAISNLSNFDTTDIRRQVELCLFFEGNTDRCFETIGTLLINVAASQDEIMKSCEAAPEEFRDECYTPNLSQQQQNATNEQDKTTTGLSSFQLPYPVLIVGCAIPAIFLIYYFYRSKKKRERFINKQITH